MQSSIQRMVSDGTLQFIDLAIEYIDKVNVKVSVDDVPIGAPGSGTPYTYEWITATRIKITPVVPVAGIVILRRVTPTLKMYHVYDDGATFNDFTMDENFKQLLFIGQEAIDGGVATDFYADVNIHGYKLTNLGNATELTDAISLGQCRSESQAGVLRAEVAAAAAETALDKFTDIYLGAYTVDPVVDNDGHTLATGALYFNTATKQMRVYSGAVWEVSYANTSNLLSKSANLSDVPFPNAAASNLGLVKQVTYDDLTPGSLLTVGAFGLGLPTNPMNPDIITVSGLTQCVAGLGTLPVGFLNGVVLTQVRSLSPYRASQHLMDDFNGRCWVRGTSGGVSYTAWSEVQLAKNTFGVGQVPMSMLGSRVLGTSYRNTTGRPILVSAVMTSTAAFLPLITVGSVDYFGSYASNGSNYVNVTAIVPDDAYYTVNTSAGIGTIYKWVEYR